MLIKNTEDRIVSLAGMAVLMPGVNDVPDAVWKKLESQENVKRLVDGGTLQKVSARDAKGQDVTAATVPGATAGASFDINAVDPAEAKRIVGETFDRALLGTWAKEATNKDVKGAIEHQLQATGISPEEAEAAMKKKR